MNRYVETHEPNRLFLHTRELLCKLLKCTHQQADKIVTANGVRELVKTMTPGFVRYRKVIQIKSSGKKRICWNPCPPLKAVQRQINELMRTYPIQGVSSFGTSAIKRIIRKREYESILSLDIENFYPSITTAVLVDVFRRRCSKIRDEFPNALEDLAEILFTHDGVLSQGAPTSPYLADLVLADSDRYLRNYLNKYIKGATFLRYVDNYYILLPKGTTPEQVKKFIGTTIKTLEGIGLKINHSKTNVMRSNQSMQVLGMVANPVPEAYYEYLAVEGDQITTNKRIQTYGKMRVSRKYCEEAFRSLCFLYSQEKEGTRVDSHFYHSACGMIAHIKSTNGRLKGCFTEVAKQIMSVSKNEHAGLLYKMVTGETPKVTQLERR